MNSVSLLEVEQDKGLGERKTEREILEDYLFKVKRCKKKKAQLINRIAIIKREFESPLKATGYSSMPRNPSPENSGAASLTLKLADIEERIHREQDNIAKSIVEVMDIIELLSVDSDERQILELKYIDCMSGKRIEEQMSYSRTACYAKKIEGLNKLLEFKKVQAIIKKHYIH